MRTQTIKNPDPMTLVELRDTLHAMLAAGMDGESEVRVNTYLRGTTSNGSLIKRITVVSHDQ